MYIPENIQNCIDLLETAGFAAYAVGGCVRDACLGLQPHDYDLCTSALPAQTEEVFRDYRLVLAGEKHGTVTVLTKGGPVEITTFRTEGGYRDNRHPDWVKFVPDIQGDLARRDFTINAMAYSPRRGFADPFGGREDLNNHILRAVGDPEARFAEDSLRILRGVRFADRFGLIPEEKTMDAMLAQAGRMENLARERVFEELCKLLLAVKWSDITRFAPILAAVIPELAPMIGFDQHSPHHAYDLITHTAHVVEGVPATLPLRWAALLHDTGKVTTFTLDATGRGHFYGHAKESAAIADGILRRLKAPTALREEVVTLIGRHMTRLQPDRKFLRRQVSKFGFALVETELSLQEADMGSKGTGEDDGSSLFAEVRGILAELKAEDACLNLKDLAVNGNDLMALGFHGKEIGSCLNFLLEQVIEEQLPNEKTALLAFAAERREETQ